MRGAERQDRAEQHDDLPVDAFVEILAAVAAEDCHRDGARDRRDRNRQPFHAGDDHDRGHDRHRSECAARQASRVLALAEHDDALVRAERVGAFVADQQHQHVAAGEAHVAELLAQHAAAAMDRERDRVVSLRGADLGDRAADERALGFEHRPRRARAPCRGRDRSGFRDRSRGSRACAYPRSFPTRRAPAARRRLRCAASAATRGACRRASSSSG